jgi:hypothetical protein
LNRPEWRGVTGVGTSELLWQQNLFNARDAESHSGNRMTANSILTPSTAETGRLRNAQSMATILLLLVPSKPNWQSLVANKQMTHGCCHNAALTDGD